MGALVGGHQSFLLVLEGARLTYAARTADRNSPCSPHAEVPRAPRCGTLREHCTLTAPCTSNSMFTSRTLTIESGFPAFMTQMLAVSDLRSLRLMDRQERARSCFGSGQSQVSIVLLAILRVLAITFASQQAPSEHLSSPPAAP